MTSPMRLGFIIGLVFGAVNLLVSWLYPLLDDTPAGLLRFYGPMFFLWALASFQAARRSGRLLSGLTAGVTVAFGTFLVFDLLVMLRVNLFLSELTVAIPPPMPPPPLSCNVCLIQKHAVELFSRPRSFIWSSSVALVTSLITGACLFRRKLSWRR